MSPPTILDIDGASRAFGSLRAVDEVTCSVRAGSRHALIGPNGAGKSTLFNLVAGTVPVTGGRILFTGQDITRMPEYRRARLGIARTFQHASVFPRGSVLENVLTAVTRHAGRGHHMLRPALRHRALVERCDEALERVGLAGMGNRLAAELSHGERRQVELAMALAVRPALLLLDEPAAGISVAETTRLARLLTELPADITVLLIEHDLDLVFDVADTVTVLHLGRHLATGTPAEVRADDRVRAAYLDEDDEELFTDGGGGR